MAVVLKVSLVTSAVLQKNVSGILLTAEGTIKNNEKGELDGENVGFSMQNLHLESSSGGNDDARETENIESKNAEDVLDDLPLGAEASGQGGGEEVDNMEDASDDDNTVQHPYFGELNLPEESSSNIDAMSDVTSTAPACKRLSSGKQWGVHADDISTLFTRATQRDAGSSSNALSAGLNELFLACRTGDTRVVDQIIERGDIDVNKPSDGKSVSLERLGGGYNNLEGTTALMIASTAGQSSVVQRLLATPEINVNAFDGESYTALLLASMKGHDLVVQQLLAHPQIDVNKADQESGLTALMVASDEGHGQVVQHLLAHPQINVNAADEMLYTALTWASMNDHDQVVPHLLAHPQIDVNKANQLGSTALITASRDGHGQVVQHLLAHPQIDVNKADNIGYTALMYASNDNIKKMILNHPSFKNE